MSYKERAEKNHAKLTWTKGIRADEELEKVIAQNRKILKDAREGDYLLKRYDILDKDGVDNSSDKYVFFGYMIGSWAVFSTRANAQWFSREEVREILSQNGMMPLKVVKK